MKTFPTDGKFHLVPLGYENEALSPVIGTATLSFHHGKHLRAYVDNLNNLLTGSPFEGLPLEDVVAKADGNIRNNAGQVLNHNLYFTQWRNPCEDNCPVGSLRKAIDEAFGSFHTFRQEFQKAGTTLFGSGWVWLSSDEQGRLLITQEQNAGNPIQKGLRPLLTFDVWEHAYYLDYQNRRADHLTALWDIINWDIVTQRYTE